MRVKSFRSPRSFIPLPEPLALPDGVVIPIHKTPTWEEQIGAFHRQPRREVPEKMLLASLCVRQLETTVDFIADIRALVDVAHRFMPELATAESGDDENGGASVSTGRLHRVSAQTVIEVAVASQRLVGVGGGSDDASDVDGVDSPYADLGLPIPDPALEKVLDVAVDVVRHLQRAHYLFRRAPITLVTRERLPLLVPCVVRHVRDGGVQEAADLVLLVAHTAPPPIEAPEPLRQDELDQIPETIELGRRGRVFFSLVEFAREAQVAIHGNGDFRAGVLFGAISAETFLDDLFAHLLWKKQPPPRTPPRSSTANHGSSPVYEPSTTRGSADHGRPTATGRWRDGSGTSPWSGTGSFTQVTSPAEPRARRR